MTCTGGGVRGKKAKLFLIATLFLAFGVSLFWHFRTAKADDPYDINGNSWCGQTLGVENATYTLSANLTCSGDGLLIGANGVTINGDGHSLTGNATGSGIKSPEILVWDEEAEILVNGEWVLGAYVGTETGYTDITIKNFGSSNNGISGFEVGICLKYSGSSLENNSVIQDNIINQNYDGIQISGSDFTEIIRNVTCYNTNTGINIQGSSSNVIRSNIANSNGQGGISVSGSNYSILEYNTANSNNTKQTTDGHSGISIAGSSLSVLKGNTTKFNRYGINLSGSTSCNLSDNTAFMNEYGIYDNNAANNSYYDSDSDEGNNQSSHNSDETMISFVETTGADPGDRQPGDARNFTITAKNFNGATCTDCTLAVVSSPIEAMPSIANNGSGGFSGSFTPTRSGTYSLSVKVTDSKGNIAERKYIAFVGDISVKTTTYYFHVPYATHLNIMGYKDAGKYLLSPSANSEYAWCGGWVQITPDELPLYPLANLFSFSNAAWLKMRFPHNAYLGLKRYADYTRFVDPNPSPQGIDYTNDYVWVSNTFENLNWSMEYQKSWFLFTTKFDNTGDPMGEIFWATFPAKADADPTSWALNAPLDVPAKSYADFTYQYTTSPAVKSITNEDINILSVTENEDGTSKIVLDATGLDSTPLTAEVDNKASTNIVLGDDEHPFRQPFLSSIQPTVIDSNGTATFQANDVISKEEIDSADMSMQPVEGSITVKVNDWNLSGDYSREWVENGTGVTHSVPHTIGSLEADHYYIVTNNSGWTHVSKADDDGKISFTYDGGYSEHTFNLTEDTTDPITSISVNPSSPNGSGGYYKSAPTITLSASDSGSGVSKKYYRWGASGEYTEYSGQITALEGIRTLYYYSVDLAGNSELVQSVDLKVDLTAPILTTPFINASTTEGSMAITGSASDAGSGFDSLTINNIAVSNPGNFTATALLDMGENIFTVKASDNAGNSVTKILTITRTAPALASTTDEVPVTSEASAVVTPAALSVQSDTDSTSTATIIPNTFSIFDSADGQDNPALSGESIVTINTQLPTFRGRTTPNSIVELEIHSDVVYASTTSDNDGYWEYKLTQALPWGAHNIKITVKNTSGAVLTNQEYSFQVVEKAQAVVSEPKSETDKNQNLVWMCIAGCLIVISCLMFVLKRKKHPKRTS